MKKIGFIVGSLRKNSYNLKVAKKFIELLPEGYEGEIVEIADLPFYNVELENNLPESWVRFRKQVGDLDGVFFITPEYNRSVPGFLKNAIDVGSRPFGKAVWGGKPTVVVSVSQGAIGGFGANHHLRQSLVHLDAPVLGQPEAYIGHINKLIDKDDNVAESLLGFLQSIVDGFVKLAERY